MRKFREEESGVQLLVVFDSLTGNVARFVDKLQLPSVQISEGLIINEPFVLVTYTTGFGEVPSSTLEFLKRNNQLLIGVAVSGNRNWGQFFARSGEIIANMYGVPLILKFELHGTPQDVTTFKEGVQKLYGSLQIS